MSENVTAAAERVTAFLDARATMGQQHPEIIHTVAVGGEFYPLNVSDLRALVAALAGEGQ